jgi:hypothetical protein
LICGFEGCGVECPATHLQGQRPARTVGGRGGHWSWDGAQDIALLVWKRAVPPRPELDITGSAVVLKRFLATDYIPDPRTTPAH